MLVAGQSHGERVESVRSEVRKLVRVVSLEGEGDEGYEQLIAGGERWAAGECRRRHHDPIVHLGYDRTAEGRTPAALGSDGQPLA